MDILNIHLVLAICWFLNAVAAALGVKFWRITVVCAFLICCLDQVQQIFK